MEDGESRGRAVRYLAEIPRRREACCGSSGPDERKHLLLSSDG
jgi:hypothetical protein